VTYRVRVAPTAGRQLTERLPESVAAACIEFLLGPLADNPYRVGAPLRPPFEGQFRARRGEYRIRYRIDDDQRAVYVLDIDHRRDAYR
jgi:mRNA-degrading endonuclease RelE of RelBE toxin-antitoxin system